MKTNKDEKINNIDFISFLKSKSGYSLFGRPHWYWIPLIFLLFFAKNSNSSGWNFLGGIIDGIIIAMILLGIMYVFWKKRVTTQNIEIISSFSDTRNIIWMIVFIVIYVFLSLPNSNSFDIAKWFGSLIGGIILPFFITSTILGNYTNRNLRTFKFWGICFLIATVFTIISKSFTT